MKTNNKNGNFIFNSISWGKKIFCFAGSFVLLLLIVGGVASKTIFNINESLETLIAKSQLRVDGTASVHLSLLELEKSIATAIAENDKKDIRTQAVSAIRALSIIDEQVQKLNAVLIKNKDAMELQDRIKKIRPKQMEIIKAAKKNDDSSALDSFKQIAPDRQRISELSTKLLEKEKLSLQNQQTEVIERGRRFVGITLALLLVGVVVGSILGIALARRLTRPLREVESAMNSVANGDLTIRLQSQSGDELGKTVAAIAKMIEKLQEILCGVTAKANSLNDESLSVTEAASAIQNISAELHSQIGNIRHESTFVFENAKNLGARFGETETSARLTTESSRRAASEIMETVKAFKQFQHNMENTASSTRELAEFAKKVTSITDTISTISSQTNLLALNAAIEAARAGEHGRGFAVVADEVRMLAQRTDNSTAEISSLVDEITLRVQQTEISLNESVSAANENIESLIQLAENVTGSSDSAKNMLDFVAEANNMMQSQGDSINRINASVSSLFELSEQTNQKIEMLHQLSETLQTASNELSGSVEYFNL